MLLRLLSSSSCKPSSARTSQRSLSATPTKLPTTSNNNNKNFILVNTPCTSNYKLLEDSVLRYIDYHGRNCVFHLYDDNEYVDGIKVAKNLRKRGLNAKLVRDGQCWFLNIRDSHKKY